MTIHEKRFTEMTAEELYAVLKLRSDVFIVEQRCAYADLDGKDREAVHVWIERDGDVVACLRVMDRGAESEDVSIGRVATLERGIGLGRRVMEAGIKAAKSRFGAGRIYLEAQAYAAGFYEKLGFHAISGKFILDGIPHVRMLRDEGADGKEKEA